MSKNNDALSNPLSNEELCLRFAAHAVRELEEQTYLQRPNHGEEIPPEVYQRFRKRLQGKRLRYACSVRLPSRRVLKTAVLIVILMTLCIGAVTAIHHLLIQQHGEYAVVYDRNATVNSDPKDWDGYYLPYAIPEGFTYITSEDIPGQRTAIYRNAASETIYFYQCNHTFYFDNESDTAEYVTVGEHEGYFITKEEHGSQSLFWMIGDTSFFLETQSADIDRKEFMYMAESVTQIGDPTKEEER